MKRLLFFFWVGAIFVFTCTSSFDALLEDGTIHFQLRSQPPLSEFFEALPHTLSPNFLIQKTGHTIAFFILSILSFRYWKSKSLGFMFSASYAFLTEVLQMFFYRDGRLFDLGFDGIGILMGLIVFTVFAPEEQSINWPF